MKKLKKIDKNYLLIIVFGLLALYLVVPENYIFGSNTDWVSQHIVFPDYFRKLFYSTKNLFPNLALSIGAGQNIYNFSYYGLLSPWLLLSYLFPFISMKNYIIILNSVIYCLFGVLLYKFLKPKYKENISLAVTILTMCAAPILFHLHRHFMFVNYLPFLILGLIGVDRYFESGKRYIISISIFLIIMTSYYFSVFGIGVICIYGLYKYLESTEIIKFKILIKEMIKFLIPVFIGILLSSLLLLPTIYVLKTGRAEVSKTISLANYFIPHFGVEFFLYSNYGLGLTSIAMIGLFSFICSGKKEKKCLGILLLLILTVPLFIYLLNGNLYYRGKVLIPAIPLFSIIIADLLTNIVEKKIEIKKLLFITTLCVLASLLSLYFNIVFYIEIVCMILIIYFYYKEYTNKKMLILVIMIPALITVYVSNAFENYVFSSTKGRDQKTSADIEKVLKKEKNLVRFNNLDDTLSNVNEVYITKYNQDSLYSSVSNPLYKNFYTKVFKNALSYRNNLVLAQNNDILFQTFMGVKYIYSKEGVPIGYTKIADNIYKNNNVLPVFYGTDDLTSKKVFNRLNYPYNIGTLLNSVVVDGKSTKDATNTIEEIPLDYNVEKEEGVKVSRNDKYIKVKSKGNGRIVLNTNQKLDEEILIIQFKLKDTPDCKKGDARITINGISNTLTCKQWIYKNNNKVFNYVISSNKDLSKLEILFDKGVYKIKNIKAYELKYSDIEGRKKSLSKFNLNQSKTIGDTITGSIDMKDDGYFVTSIPYDKGFNVFVDGKSVKKEIVNTAFLGFKLDKGYHKIKIVYHSPLFREGSIISIIGLILLFIEIFIDLKKKRT